MSKGGRGGDASEAELADQLTDQVTDKVEPKRPNAKTVRMAAQPPPPPPAPVRPATSGEPTIAGIHGPRPASKADVLDNLPTVALGGDAPVPHEPHAAGTHVGRYLIVEHVGAGGLGDVYKAYDPELDRRVAIKLLRAEVVDANRRLGDPTDRLRREAQALAKLRHPNVVAVHDVGTFRGEVFIAMEFAHGRTLLPWARAHDHDWRALRDVFVHAGEGLAAAHAAGLVHRDFKPANVVVGEDRHVTVLDFGLARAADGPGSDELEIDTEIVAHTDKRTSADSLLSREVTGGSLLLGTPPYMAPELFDGSAATTLSDQFAFCAALYRVLFNRLPFVARSSSEFCAAVGRGDLNFSGNAIPGWLARVIARGLAARPADRFPTMTALLGKLQTDRRRRRNRWIALSVLVPLAGVGTAVGAWALRPPPTAAERAVTEQLATEARAAAARGFYVHPPPEEPQTDTALTKVLELEGLTGAIADEADQTAAGLRGEFAEALIRLGDRYYERDGGAPFAADFYASALVFDPDNRHAGDRVALSDAQLATLVKQAEAQSFSDRELAAAQPLTILAALAPGERDEKLRDFLEKDKSTPARTKTMLAGLVRGRGERAAEPTAVAAAARPTPADIEPTKAAPDVDVAEILIEPEALSDDKRGGGARPAAPTVDKGRAAEAAKQGKAAASQGDLTRAASHFHRALEHDRKNLAALKGLAELHYERSEYAKALRYAERARALAPRSTKLLLLIGDAHVREIHYAKARKAYERAKELGAKRADDRLARLRAKLGE
ncbi:MAG: protein kinase [Myxococcota bacterium]